MPSAEADVPSPSMTLFHSPNSRVIGRQTWHYRSVDCFGAPERVKSGVSGRGPAISHGVGYQYRIAKCDQVARAYHLTLMDRYHAPGNCPKQAQARYVVSGRVQNETARGNKMRLCITLLSSPVGRATNPRFSRQNTGSCAVCWGGRASGGNGLPSPRSRCRRSPPRNGLAPPSPTGASTMSIRTPLNELAPRLQQQNPSLILFPQRVSF
jgi:hypothetical protein